MTGTQKAFQETEITNTQRFDNCQIVDDGQI